MLSLILVLIINKLKAWSGPFQVGVILQQYIMRNILQKVLIPNNVMIN